MGWAQPKQSLQASAGAGSKLAWGSGGYALEWPVWKERLALGFGLRTTIEKSGERVYHSAEADLSSAQQERLVASPVLLGNAALFLTIQLKLAGRFGLGFNIDAAGYTFGRNDNARYGLDGLGPQVVLNGSQYSLLLGNQNDHGFLHSEFYLSYKASRRVQVRAGFSHQNLELRLREPVTPGKERFREFVNSGFVGVAVGLGGVK